MSHQDLAKDRHDENQGWIINEESAKKQGSGEGTSSVDPYGLYFAPFVEGSRPKRLVSIDHTIKSLEDGETRVNETDFPQFMRNLLG